MSYSAIINIYNPGTKSYHRILLFTEGVVIIPRKLLTNITEGLISEGVGGALGGALGALATTRSDNKQEQRLELTENLTPQMVLEVFPRARYYPTDEIVYLEVKRVFSLFAFTYDFILKTRKKKWIYTSGRKREIATDIIAEFRAVLGPKVFSKVEGL